MGPPAASEEGRERCQARPACPTCNVASIVDTQPGRRERKKLATRTFFNYFSSKEEALLGNAPRNVAAVHRLVVERPAGESPLEAVCQVLRTMILELAERQ